MNVTFNPNVSSYQQNVSTPKMRTNNVQFTGQLGDKLLEKGVENLDVPTVMSKIKGTFGIKAEKVEDVLGSLLEFAQNLTKKNSLLETDLRKANAIISEIPSLERKAATTAAEEQIRRYSSIINGKNEEIAAKDLELNEARTVAEKFKPAFSVKSVEEIGTVMPERALKVLNEMVEHKATANKSMFDFLMTGKGQEEALAQIERNNILMKANRDGIMNIPSVQSEYQTISKENNIFYSYDSNFTIKLIEKALKSNPKGEYITSRAVREQVKQNAMAFLTPMADERYSNTDLKAIEVNLDSALDSVTKFHDGFKKGIAKYQGEYNYNKDFTYIINRVENDIDKSTVTFKYSEKGKPHNWESTFEQLANYGNLNWH